MSTLAEGGTAAIGAGFMATMVVATVLNCTSAPPLPFVQAYPGVPGLVAARLLGTALLPVGKPAVNATNRNFAPPSFAFLGDRPTTALEQLVGEIRSYGVLGDNWDGEGAVRPSLSSIRGAVKFVHLMDPSIALPEPMLFASGRAGLFWNSQSIYADLEFTEDQSITYFVEHRGKGKHKGVVAFDSKAMPAVFATLLSA